MTIFDCRNHVQGATWDTDLVYQWGAAMGKEFFGKGANVQLGPGVNVARVPRNGRNFEYMVHSAREHLIYGRGEFALDLCVCVFPVGRGPIFGLCLGSTGGRGYSIARSYSQCQALRVEQSRN